MANSKCLVTFKNKMSHFNADLDLLIFYPESLKMVVFQEKNFSRDQVRRNIQYYRDIQWEIKIVN